MKQVDEMSKQEQEKLLEKIIKDLKENLSEKRYLHSVSTMKKAKEIAIEYKQDEMKVMLTALAHDIAKEITDEQYFEYAKRNNIKLDEFDKIETIVLHGRIGAHIVGTKYSFTKEMQNAIEYHTTGRANMTMLDKIVFLADKSEDRKEGEEVIALRRIMEQEGLDKAILWNIDFQGIPNCIKKQTIIHPNCIFTRNDIILKMKSENI